MSIKIEIGKDPDVERVKKDVQKGRKRLKRYTRVAHRERVKSYLKIVRYYYKYKRAYKVERPTYTELMTELTTPERVYAWCKGWVKVVEGEDVTEPKDVVKTGISTEKGLVSFMATTLHRHGYMSYILWVGYTNDKIMPLCVIKLRQYEISIGSAYRLHPGSKDDILHDYFPEGNKWVIVDREMDNPIVDFEEGRTPQIMVYDEEWMREMYPNTYEVQDKMHAKRLLNSKVPPSI